MKKVGKKIGIVLAALVLVFALMLAGCAKEAASVISIQKTDSNGKQDIYTVYYSDGTTSSMTVTNGNDITVEMLYAYYKQVYGDELTYAEFLEKYLSVTTDNSAVIGECLQSSVKLYTEFVETTTVSSGIFGGITSSQTAVYTGSGVIYDMDEDYTYIITNYHVVYDNKAGAANGNSQLARKIVCYLYGSEGDPAPDGRGMDGYQAYDYGDYAIECEFVGGSVTNDIAVIRAETRDISQINPNVATAEFASEYHVGETAIAIGNPEGAGISVTEGIVSVDNEYISLQIDSTTRSYRSLRIDTAIYGGSSGGGLFNLHGELIGITNAGNSTDQNINYAIPLEIAKGTADNILYYHRDGDDSTNGVYKVYFGVGIVVQNSRYIYDASSGYGRIQEEIVVNSTERNSIAKTIGLEVNDRLTAINIGDRKITLDREFDISDAALLVRPGDTVSFDVTRGGTAMTSGSYTVKSSDLTLVS